MKEKIKEFGGKVKQTVVDNKSKIIKGVAVAGGAIAAVATAAFVTSRCGGCSSTTRSSTRSTRLRTPTMRSLLRRIPKRSRRKELSAG